MKIVFAAGGTGGHIVPALSVAEILRKDGHEVVFLGVGRAVEERLIKGAQFRHEILPATALTGGGIRGLVRAILLFPRGLVSALKLLSQIKPNVVVGFGGYPEVFPIIAAALLGIPRAVQEQNGKVGVANKLLSVICQRVFAPRATVGFFRKGNVLAVDNPVREEFLKESPFVAPKQGQALKVLVLGGSQGATGLNSAILKLVDLFISYDVKLTHQTGEVDFNRVSEQYNEAGYQPLRVVAFIDDVRQALAETQLIISRAGAMAVSEIRAMGRPAIFVPLEIARGHQALNVTEMVNDGGAIIVRQDCNFLQNLRTELSKLLLNRELITSMASRAKSKTASNPASSQIAEEILKLVPVHKSQF